QQVFDLFEATASALDLDPQPACECLHAARHQYASDGLIGRVAQPSQQDRLASLIQQQTISQRQRGERLAAFPQEALCRWVQEGQRVLCNIYIAHALAHPGMYTTATSIEQRGSATLGGRDMDRLVFFVDGFNEPSAPPKQNALTGRHHLRDR